MRLFRPYISLAIRVQVALRQCREAKKWVEDPREFGFLASAALKSLLSILFNGDPYELHHRPALMNRLWNARKKDYDPPANSPDHLVYLLKHGEHDIETRVRGQGAQRSDLAQRRYLNNVERNRGIRKRKRPEKVKIPSAKRTWPTRSFSKSK